MEINQVITLPAAVHRRIDVAFKFDALTSLRGIAALCTLFVHLVAVWAVAFPAISHWDRFHQFATHCYLLVDFFFILSGFVMSHVYGHRFRDDVTMCEPLGIVDAWMWAREKKDKLGIRGGPKESLRWIEGYERIAEMAAHMPDTRLVYVADREADLMPLMLRAQELGAPADWLVRAAHNRCLPDGEKLWQHTGTGEPVGEISFAMAARHGVKARTVRQQLWVRKVELQAGKGKTVSATCIIAREIDAPAGTKPIEWRLRTSREAGTLAAAVELIDWYRGRLEIEILFNVLKNACKVEALQLGSIPGYGI